MKNIIITLLVLAGIAYAYYNSQSEKTLAKKERPIPNVVVANAKMMQVRDEVEAIGTGKAYESITVTSKISEIITSLNFEDGQLVKKGQLLVQLQDTEQQAKVRAASVVLKEHIREFDRISSLVTSKTVAETERDRLQSLIDSARAVLDQEVAALADRTINAPFSGRLGIRNVSRGSFVTPSQAITTLDDVSKIKLDFSVPERFIQELQVGKQILAETVAFPDTIFKGKVTVVDSRVNPVTRAVIVRAIVPNADHALLPGMLMKVNLIKQSREALLLPESAIIPIQDKHYVYLVNSENKIERLQIHIGLRTRGWVEVVDGLKVGDPVVIRGLLKVRPGDTVTPEQAERFHFALKGNAETAA
ncbi:efflux RND transporter periplasmic adaptor subunit [Shewanella intestini]|uniref:Efflux RND transporter periplasmic adaptor subunit n=1 Tax=Shewanella intestini TaxID=2017544 RepID=A0ABS5HZN7_9GAMM|nr:MULTISPECIES: efflux RND transporter periplasmic adaptor subunit [Shewanella]MBR9727245.1 efflux RND transporter periplasmic adaptor subunit [Shewanella intestini]MRG36047.1 efflux RND transporter periplasmic adaptor subunit [Shewanella sp. XMDDZSB0408]